MVSVCVWLVCLELCLITTRRFYGSFRCVFLVFVTAPLRFLSPSLLWIAPTLGMDTRVDKQFNEAGIIQGVGVLGLDSMLTDSPTTATSG